MSAKYMENTTNDYHHGLLTTTPVFPFIYLSLSLSLSFSLIPPYRPSHVLCLLSGKLINVFSLDGQNWSVYESESKG